MTHRRWIALVLLIVVAVVGVVTIGFCSPPALSRDEMEQVRKGMSREQVREIVGRPGDYSDYQSHPLPHFRFDKYESWLSKDNELLVLFDVSGIAQDVVVMSVEPANPPPTSLDRFGSRWRRFIGME